MNFNILAPQAHLLMLSFTLHMSSRGGGCSTQEREGEMLWGCDTQNVASNQSNQFICERFLSKHRNSS